MFRGLNGLRSGIKEHMGPTWIKKKINISKKLGFSEYLPEFSVKSRVFGTHA